MIPFTLSAITKLLNAELIGNDIVIENIVIDSRSLACIQQCLFIAIKGKYFDGHDFAEQAIKLGAVALLVTRRLSLDVSQLLVADTEQALSQLGAWIRQQVSARIVALTGSSGKTHVKEMTAAILRQCGRVLATKDNLNNNIGVSLTLLNLKKSHDYAVIELGANHFGEIAWTTNLVRPETALINNLSFAHLAGFCSMAGVAQAKGEIFTGVPINGRCIINADSNDWFNWQQLLNNKKIWRFAIRRTKNIDFFASDIKTDHQHITYFTLHSPLGKCPIKLLLPGKHNIANALAACALAISVGADLSAVTTGLAQFRGLPGRLFPIMLSTTSWLLDDSYNANVSSMIAAAQVLAKMPGYRVMIVGDMDELGEEAKKYHWQVGKAISIIGVDKVLSIGKLSNFIAKASGRGEHFYSKITLINRIMQLLSEKITITILVKGSRSAAMEWIIKVLREKTPC